ncbi:MAG: NAD(P)H-binding protein [Polyangiaceae bacterium]
MTVLVTGATGNVGREVVRALRARGVSVRAADRQTNRSTTMFEDDAVATARLDFRDSSTFAAAVEGCSALFLLRPPPISDVTATLNPFVDVARERGVRQVVFLSVAGAGKNKLVPHHAVEVHLAARSNDWTVLRPGFFAQNLGDAYRADIVEDDRLFVPAGRGRVAFVDVRDVAEVAAAALCDPAAHAAKAYTLTGPAAVSFEDAAAILTEALRRTIRYDRASIAGYALHLHRRGMPAAQVAVQTILHVGLRFGQAATIDPTLHSLLGRSGRSLREYVFDHIATWQHLFS